MSFSYVVVGFLLVSLFSLMFIIVRQKVSYARERQELQREISNFIDTTDLNKEQKRDIGKVQSMVGKVRSLCAVLSNDFGSADPRSNEARELRLALEPLKESLASLADGNLRQQIKNCPEGHFKEVFEAYDVALEKISGALSSIASVAVNIETSIGDISQASDDLAQRTENQAATLEETAISLDQITKGVTAAASNAQGVEEIVSSAKNDSSYSEKIVRNAVDAMSEIEQSSSQISQIILVIDDIAFQTNLLALNAGVEAARAGDAGKGFAVVASEVRALAQRSSEAAEEIKKLIGDSSKQVKKGVDLVGKAGGALQTIAGRVEEISSLISDIAHGAAEQSKGLEEINDGVAQLDSVTQQNAAMVEEATASSHALRGEAELLTNLLGQFQIGDETTTKQPLRNNELSTRPEAIDDAPANIALKPSPRTGGAKQAESGGTLEVGADTKVPASVRGAKVDENASQPKPLVASEVVAVGQDWERKPTPAAPTQSSVQANEFDGWEDF